ncbi:MAG: PaaI family thioesterase [Alphaproteobacteria bacterium]|nr:MAG: PaaI family thioesterase [Alphaproteobacteria bacterium]
MARMPLRGPKVATPEMIAGANPPEGYEPIVSSSPFGWENGPIFHKATDDGYWRGFRVAERHINAAGICHGGMMMTFADVLMASAILRHERAPIVTVRLTTDFIGAAYLGDWVEGDADMNAMDDGLIAVRGIIRVKGRPVASVEGLFKRFERKD